MIDSIKINNFKSIKDLQLYCKKLNVFLGSPNTGKSNLLEAIGLVGVLPDDFKETFRFQGMSNLFFDNDISNKIAIDIIRAKGSQSVELTYSEEKFVFSVKTLNTAGGFHEYDYKFDDLGAAVARGSIFYSGINYYKFKENVTFNDFHPDHLRGPQGKNLLSILKSNKTIREDISYLFSKFGYKLVIRERDDRNGDTLEIGKNIDDILRLFPYASVSDTLKRLCFFNVAIESNKNSTLLFEEPEAHTFPLYTKELGERIALDETNQYFIITHNPFLLHSLMSKSRKQDLAINIVYSQDFQTKVKQIDEKELQGIIAMDYDIFYNLDKFLPYDIN